MDADTVLLESGEHMKKGVEYMIHEFAGVRTGKASPTIVEMIDVHVASYGSTMKLKQLAVIRAPEPRLIVIEPFDPRTTHDIERGLKESKLGINPVVDGKQIRLPFPELSEERRRELVKVVKQMAEEARVRVRHSRKETLDKVRHLQKEGTVTEDDMHRLEKQVQKLTDDHVAEIDDHVNKKEKEIMTV